MILRALFVLGMLLVKDFLFYKGRGHVQPDNPHDENYPVITGPGDAMSQKIIDQSKRRK